MMEARQKFVNNRGDLLYSTLTIKELLEAKEGERVQFKEAKNRFDSNEAARCCCALANCGGGKLVFGITDKRPRQVVGSAAFEQPERTRKGLIDKLKIMVDFQLYSYEGKRVLVFEVSSRPLGLPIQADGVAWWYEGDSLIPMPEDVRRRIYEEAGFDFSGSICRAAKLNDLDMDSIESFRAKWVEKSGNKRLMSKSVEQLLYDCEAITDEGVTYAALILFGTRKSLGRFLPQAEIIFEYRSSEGAGPASQREEFREGFFACYNRLWELINLRNDKQYYQEGFFVYDIPTFNERWENMATGDFLVINALYHEMSLPSHLRARLKHLTELGIVEHMGRNKYVLARSLYAAAGKTGVHTRIVGLDRETNKELLLKHIRMNKHKGTRLKELYQVLPGHNRGQLQILMRELRNEGRIYCEGRTNAARWFATEQSELTDE